MQEPVNKALAVHGGASFPVNHPALYPGKTLRNISLLANKVDTRHA